MPQILLLKKFWLMNIKSLLTTMIFCLAASSVQAVPAKPGVKKTVRQADGTVIELTLRGDEHFAFYTDAKGKAFKLLSGDKLQPMTSDQVSDTWAKCRQAHSIDRPARTRGTGESSSATTGKHRGLVILMQFQDLEFVTHEPKQVFNRFFNEVGYSEYGMSGSVKDYFRAQSYGQLDIDFDIVGPYTTTKPMAYYGGPATLDGEPMVDAHRREFAAEAVEQAAADVDYSLYDWDNDGNVDQVFIIYAGYAEASGAAPETIWPHEWSLAGLGRDFVYNGVKVSTYGCANELWGDGRNNTGILNGIGTACHEFAHCLGLPDMYNTEAENTTFGMNSWDVMDSGNYLNDSRTPAGFTSYERWFSGWLQPTELKGDMIHITDMKPLAEAPECYILYNDAHRTEYYLLENRQNVGFDAGLFGHGLLVLHVDYNKNMWSKNKINIDPDHQRMTIIPADGTCIKSAGSLAGDPFPGTTGNTALANYSSPAPTLYNANTDGSYYMNKPIDSITENEYGLISFTALRPAIATPESVQATQIEGEPSFNITWNAVSDAAGYQVELADNYIIDPTESIIIESDFVKTLTDSVDSVDISGKLADYDLDGWEGKKLFTSPNKLLIGSPDEAGTIRTATGFVPSSKTVTVVIGAETVDNTPIGGTMYLYRGNKSEDRWSGKGYYLYSESGTHLYYFTDIEKDYFYVRINPDPQMYLNYFAVYDGIWYADELGLEGSEVTGKPATKKSIFETKDTNYTLTELNPEHEYTYRVCAKDAEGFLSAWTPEQQLVFTPSGISTVQIAPQQQGVIFDLQGRPRGTDPSALPKGIYIIGGRKVVK